MESVFQKKDFVSYLQSQGYILNKQQLQQFEQYATLLQEWNQKMNLTAITQTDAIYEKHFLDSILPSFDIKLQGSLCDVGAGAGFPSIPLKILYPDLAITIIEPLKKRCLFLQEVCHTLALNITIENARAEDYVKAHREQFDFVTARAVANLVMLSELCIPLVKKGGYFLAMKGANGEEENIQASYAIQLLGCKYSKQFEHTLSDHSKRLNILYRKESNTPIKYPRPFATIKKHPLLQGGTYGRNKTNTN